MARRFVGARSRAPYAGDVRIEAVPKGTMRGGNRAPQHSWRTQIRPWELTPAFCIPVMAGDTLRSAQFQVRTIFRPPTTPADATMSLTGGWWHEMYVFFVRFGDFVDADTIRNAVIDPTQNMDAMNVTFSDAQKNAYNHWVASRPCFIYECMRSVARAYFRDEGEAWDAYMGTNGVYPLVQIVGNSWLDSVFPASALPAEGTGDAWDKQWKILQGMRGAKLTTNTWEEYLAMQGVTAPPVMRETDPDFKVPELLRFVREFAYPQTIINPSNGLVTGSVNWSTAERIDKARFADQPGFICGFQVIRPKVYLLNQRTNAADVLLNTADGWNPIQYQEEPHTSLVKFAGVGSGSGTGPVHGASVDYWMDRRDLWLRGDQFKNTNADAADAGRDSGVELPFIDLTRRKYPTTDDQVNFVGTDGGFDVDGIISARIASRIRNDISGAAPRSSAA